MVQSRFSNVGERNFWQIWGKYIIAVIVVILVVYIISLVLSQNNKSQAQKAAVIYSKFTNAVNDKQIDDAYKLAKELEKDFAQVTYSAMASIQSAKLAWESKDYTKAADFLTWTINNAKDSGFVDLARLRLANVYIDQGKFDDALNMLRAKHDPAFDALYYMGRGDLYVAKGDNLKARDAYQEALKKAGQDRSVVQAIQLKLDVLGN